MTPQASVIIPTYNRRERLARVLEGLACQSVNAEAYEVIVVDDGSTDGTPEWLKAQRYPYALRVLQQPNSGPGAARNAGVRAAAGAITIFVDDDLVPCPDLVREHLEVHETDKDVVVLGPLASLPSYKRPWVAWEQAKIEEQYKAMKRGDWEPTYRQFWSGNASMSREHFLAAGGFDPAFTRAEDVELGYRLMRRGLGFRFNPRASGMHHADRSLASWCSIQSDYGRRDVEVWRRFGDGNLKEILCFHWRERHGWTRRLVRFGSSKPIRQAAITLVLVTVLKAATRLHLTGTGLSNATCGALANVLYWDGVAAALGRDSSLYPELDAGPENPSPHTLPAHAG